MKYIFHSTLILIVFLFSCGEKAEETTQVDQPEETPVVSGNFTCAETDFESPQDWGNAILEAYQNADDSTRTDQIEWEKKLFCLFPSSFPEMETIFGYKGEAPGPLYSGGYEVVKFFANLNSIPKDIYYEKFININVNGNWQADNIRNGFGITGRFEDDTKTVCLALAERSDAEIESVFRFIYDSPHPENYQDFYEAVQKIMVPQDPRLAQLNQIAFTKLIEEDHGH